ncbi:hypothetical protein EDB80DRAFT_383870 [Ilyonectria destructans]|nr:hypothetical protein EDB80DRAFT_383870 [Ilyonectria destructans]
MRFVQTIVSVTATALIAFSPAVYAFTTACTYQQYSCGYSLVADNTYTNIELAAGVSRTVGVIPALAGNQLLQVLYRCTDTNGGIAGNSYCIAGCVSMGDLEDDQCAM